MEVVNKETKASYQPLSNLDDGEELSASKNARLLPRLSPQCFLACNVAILLLNVSLITVLMSWALTKNALRATDCMLPPTPNEKLLQRQQRTFTLSSAWSGAPSNETDQAWKNLVEDDMGAFSISGKLFQQVNPSLETGVRVPYEPEDKYVATFDVVHKLHCLVSELLQTYPLCDTFARQQAHTYVPESYSSELLPRSVSRLSRLLWPHVNGGSGASRALYRADSPVVDV
ncbi:uncharacterized protein Bfra_009528 [Botrytis fragariae]|uniref:Uncharacterized protein n=1 Tax=Botrytis fragariae TaxID=1964551 RepID=A0A8H6EG07_9HELO|nr:uncharacterized protein Bfra_009528 [Botrytis fragariae]KAF5870974.1 hypothetical protein Bfra_009528 [Botrytis fragariae]